MLGLPFFTTLIACTQVNARFYASRSLLEHLHKLNFSFLTKKGFILLKTLSQQMTVDEQERRRIRRERNKVAASKCRRKRKEHVKTLVEVMLRFHHRLFVSRIFFNVGSWSSLPVRPRKFSEVDFGWWSFHNILEFIACFRPWRWRTAAERESDGKLNGLPYLLE